MPSPPPDAPPANSLQAHTVATRLRVNGVRRTLQIDARTTLLDALREHLHLTGAKKGCDHVRDFPITIEKVLSGLPLLEA